MQTNGLRHFKQTDQLKKLVDPQTNKLHYYNPHPSPKFKQLNKQTDYIILTQPIPFECSVVSTNLDIRLTSDILIT